MKRCIKSLWSSSWLSDLFSSDSWRCVWCIFVLFFMVCPIHFLPGFMVCLINFCPIFYCVSDPFLSWCSWFVSSVFLLIVFMVCLIHFPRIFNVCVIDDSRLCFYGLSRPFLSWCHGLSHSLSSWFALCVSSIFVLVVKVCMIYLFSNLKTWKH